jgi:hypothetical protein
MLINFRAFFKQQHFLKVKEIKFNICLFADPT